jgi:hypothetical protein
VLYLTSINGRDNGAWQLIACCMALAERGVRSLAMMLLGAYPSEKDLFHQSVITGYII